MRFAPLCEDGDVDIHHALRLCNVGFVGRGPLECVIAWLSEVVGKAFARSYSF
jgi:hypothetical protein